MMGVMEINPASVLIIESHPMMREALCAAIAGECDLKVAEADINSSQILTIPITDELFFLPSNLDMILLALGNPGLNELEVLKVLRNALPKIQILALTSNEVPGQEQAALEAGAHAVLTKAASRGELIRTLRELKAQAIMNISEAHLDKEANRNNIKLVTPLDSRNASDDALT